MHYHFLNSMKSLELWECNDSHTTSSNISSTNRLIDLMKLQFSRVQDNIFQKKIILEITKKKKTNQHKNYFQCSLSPVCCLKLLKSSVKISYDKEPLIRCFFFFFMKGKIKEHYLFWLFMTTKCSIFFPFNFFSVRLKERREHREIDGLL